MADDRSIASSSTTASSRRTIFPNVKKRKEDLPGAAGTHSYSPYSSSIQLNTSTRSSASTVGSILSSPPQHVAETLSTATATTTTTTTTNNNNNRGSRPVRERPSQIETQIAQQLTHQSLRTSPPPKNHKASNNEIEELQEDNKATSSFIGMSISTETNSQHDASTNSTAPAAAAINTTSTSTDVCSTSPLHTTNMSIEKQLFHALHQRQIHNPTIKEFNECWAFTKTVRTAFKHQEFDLIIDVAGGHGALAALLLILTKARRAVVIDPARVGQNGVKKAWSHYYEGQGKALEYRHECLRSGLRDELHKATTVAAKGNAMATGIHPISPFRILVVACHACQHLTDETLEIACSYGVHVAVMPCCQKDLSGGSWKAAGKSLGIGIAPMMDILTCGKIMSWKNGHDVGHGRGHGVTYQVRMKMIDAKITPQNRIILARAVAVEKEGGADTDTHAAGGSQNASKSHNARVAVAHEKLERAYKNAHANSNVLVTGGGDVEVVAPGSNSASNSSSDALSVQQNKDYQCSSDKKEREGTNGVNRFCIKSAITGALVSFLITSCISLSMQGRKNSTRR